MKEPITNPNVILNMERRQLAFNFDPNILNTRLSEFLNNNQQLLLGSKNNLHNNSLIKEIIAKVDELSINSIKLVSDLQEKFKLLEGNINQYVMNNEQKVKNVEDNLNKIYLIINNIKEEQESFKKNYIDDFQKKYLPMLEHN